MFVIARNSTFTYKGKAVKVEQVGQELGVRYVLEGSVRKAGNRVRITAQLVDATTSHHLWAERYDRNLTDIFALQDEITQQIVGALRVEVQEAELERVKHIPTENLTAYDCVLRGWELYNRIAKETNLQARQMFERAIALDPQYAEAYVGVGWTHWMEWVWYWSQDLQTPELAFALAQKAAALDDSLPVAHMLLSQVYLLHKKQHEQAITEGERAIALDPNNADGYARMGLVLIHAGRPEKGIEVMEQAMRLNPRYPAWYSYSLGVAYSSTGQFEEAITALKRALNISPNFPGPHVHLAAIYGRLGREEEARAEAAEVLRLIPTFSLEVLRQRLPHKDPAAAERFLDNLRQAGLK